MEHTERAKPRGRQRALLNQGIVETPEVSTGSAPSPTATDALSISAQARMAIHWVFEHIEGKKAKEVDAPTPGAWGLLKMCRDDDQFRRVFYAQIWPKILPTRSDMDRMEGFEDDGRQVLKVIDRSLAKVVA